MGVNIFGFQRGMPMFFLPAVIGYFIGKYIDDKEIERSTLFRDKSKLFGGNRKPGDPPSWGPPDQC